MVAVDVLVGREVEHELLEAFVLGRPPTSRCWSSAVNRAWARPLCWIWPPIRLCPNRAFPKLGITTRSALRDALAGQPD
ncbi:hypothetical protein [Nocardia sp.]|uniref:hypothetical protein n=1 Tax=Nocardia sp. TaxID=1821 RepID=UPI002618D8A5|nr:hypothetical protein [Nocardia sp.]